MGFLAHRWTEVPPVHLQGFKVVFGRVPVALIERVRFDDRRIRNPRLEGLHHLARENIGAMAFARMELDCDPAGNVFVDKVVKLVEMLGVDDG